MSPSATHLLHMVNTKPLPSLGSAPGSRLPIAKLLSTQPVSASGTGSMPPVTALLDAKGRGRSQGLPGVPPRQYPEPYTLGKQLRGAGREGRAPPDCRHQQLLATLLTREQSRLLGVKGISCLFMNSDTLSFCAVHSPWRCFVATGPPFTFSLSILFQSQRWHLLDSFSNGE